MHYFTGFTSQHHMAAEETVRKMRSFLKLKRSERKRTKQDLDEKLNDNQQSDGHALPL